MWYLIGFYWIVAGITMFVIPTASTQYNKKELAACLFLGGFMLPAGLCLKLLYKGQI